ncbi:MAG: PqqD family protein [Candidatus Omnitrophica bacterium]|nr:PqqD family protein [Candidatus Omnitrophota bacterium]MCM8826694.1 PqqD family protein [Candidatus Omnitrophota bacterium]
MDHKDIIYKKNDEDIVYRVIENETLLVPIRHNAHKMEYMYSLNEVGAYIWNLIDGRTEMGAIIKNVISEFEVDPLQAQKDVSDFIEQLESIRAIRRVK